MYDPCIYAILSRFAIDHNPSIIIVSGENGEMTVKD